MAKKNIDNQIEMDSNDLKNQLSPLDELVNDTHHETYPPIKEIEENSGNIIHFESEPAVQNGNFTINAKSMRKRVVALVASFALILTTILTLPFLQKNGVRVFTPTTVGIDKILNDKSNPEDYSKVLKKLLQIKENVTKYEQNIFGGLFSSKNKATDEMAPNLADGEKAADSPEDLKDIVKNGELSKTNSQVEGVSEADVLKTDGTYLYYLRGNYSDDSRIEIVKTDKNGKLSFITSLKLNESDKKFSPIDMYLVDNRLVVIGGIPIDYNNNDAASPETAKMDIRYGGNNFKTKVFIIDVTNPEKCKISDEFSQDGAVISSRMVDNYLYLVSSYSQNPNEDITKDNVQDFIPSTSNTAKDEVDKSIPADKICLLPNPNDLSYSVVSAIDVADLKTATTVSVLGGGNQIYSNKENLYIAGYRYNGDVTDILRFNISKSNINLEKAGMVTGYILNQFSMDEYENHFRVATTNARGNNVYVLDSDLKVVGKVEHLAKGEQIKSARFMGNMAYIVTFLQVDPLFAIDLSNPEKPVVKSELKIPGFSSYMHPIDANTVVGIGTDGDDNGRTFGVKFSLFNTSNPKNVTEDFKITFAKEGGYSPAAYNHKAVTYIEKAGLFVIPIEVYDYEQKDNYEGFFGFYVVKADKDNGFKLVAKIPGRTPSYRQYNYEVIDNNRSAFIGNNLYTLSSSGVISVSLADFSHTRLSRF